VAVPIRLIVGPSNFFEIPLEAQSIDINVSRNANAFPTPNNIIGRVGIDTNIPEISIEIDGILQDDENFDTTESNFYEAGAVGINFASIFPTKNQLPVFSPNVQEDKFSIIKFKEDIPIQQSKVGVIDNYDVQYNQANSLLFSALNNQHKDVSETLGRVNHPSSGVYSAGTSTITFASPSIVVGNRLHVYNHSSHADGEFIGTVSAVSGNDITISGGTRITLDHDDYVYSFLPTLWDYNLNLVGSVVPSGRVDTQGTPIIKSISLDQVNVPIKKDKNYFITHNNVLPVEQILHNKTIKLYPNWWRGDALFRLSVSTSPWQSEGIGGEIIFKFDANTYAATDYQLESETGSQPSITRQGSHFPIYKADGVTRKRGWFDPVVVTLPIKGVSNNSASKNPASTIATIFNYAVNLASTAVSQGTLTSTGGTTISSAFSSVVNGPTIKITQKDEPHDILYTDTIPPCRELTDSYEPTLITDANEPLIVEYFTSSSVNKTISNNGKSAGDKVQDLLGIVSNARKQVDLIRGLQIPYDSLIQSDAVSPTARNFFLTFGEQANDAKGSIGNAISASKKMIPASLPSDLGGESNEDSGFLDMLGPVGDFANATGALLGFVADFVSDSFITLTSTSNHSNEGGIRIIPEKLHVRYDAGNNYYAYKLLLKASDYVIGV